MGETKSLLAAAPQDNTLRADVIATWQPSPGEDDWPLPPHRPFRQGRIRTLRTDAAPSKRPAVGTINNRLLLALPGESRGQVLRACASVEFKSGDVIYSAGDSLQYGYFINAGLVSLVKGMTDGRTVAVGAVGSEGLVGPLACHGFEHAITDHIAQVPVAALRIDRQHLHTQVLIHQSFRDLMMRYLFLFTGQLAQATACNRLHSLEQRFCHWLLLVHDSVRSEEVPFTHETLALLLGVQRPSVSIVANALQKRGIIRYSHGRVAILNRPILERVACECYAILRSDIEFAFRDSLPTYR